jgi:hypothetical protein
VVLASSQAACIYPSEIELVNIKRRTKLVSFVRGLPLEGELGSEQMNERFAIFCALVVAFVWTVGSVPIYSDALSNFFEQDLLSGLGSGSQIGFRKWALSQALLAASFAALVLAALAFPGPLSLRKIVILGCSIATLLPLPLWYQRARDDEAYTSLQRLSVVSIQPLPSQELLTKKSLPKEALASFDALYREVMHRYRVLHAELQSNWSGSEGALKAIFFTNFVSGLYEFGNREAHDQVGCVGQNELISGEPVRPALTEAEILESRIGCCTDFARALKALLDRAGLENRVVVLPGHVFNEAKVDGIWRALDANINVVYDRSWQEIVFAEGQAPVRADWYFLEGTRDPRQSAYRPLLTAFRVQMMLFAGRQYKLFHYATTVS